jgi:hypothetical protein
MSAACSKAGETMRWPWAPTRSDKELDEKDAQAGRVTQRVDRLIDELERIMDRVEDDREHAAARRRD